MTKKSTRHQNRGTPRNTQRKTIMDNLAWGTGYMPRPGIDVPMMSAGVYQYLQPIEAEIIYLKNTIAANIVDIPAGDLVRNGWSIQAEDKYRQNIEKIESRMLELGVKKKLKQLHRYERLYGVGAIMIGTDETNRNADEPLEETAGITIKHLTVFSKKKISGLEYNHDVLSPEYGQTESVTLGGIKIDSSRLLIQQSLLFEDDAFGRSIYERIMTEMNTSKQTLESVTRILSDYVFKVYKTPLADSMTPDEKLMIASVANSKFETDGMAIIQADEDLTHEVKTVTGIDQLLGYLWERIAAASRMPKSVIMGQETGVLTGAKYDLMNYYARISDDQESELRPHLEKLIRLLFWEQGIDPGSVKWKLQFNPLYQEDGASNANIKYLEAQADKIYLEGGVITPEEVHDNRFGQIGMTNSAKQNADSLDFDWED